MFSSSTSSFELLHGRQWLAVHAGRTMDQAGLRVGGAGLVSVTERKLPRTRLIIRSPSRLRARRKRSLPTIVGERPRGGGQELHMCRRGYCWNYGLLLADAKVGTTVWLSLRVNSEASFSLSVGDNGGGGRRALISSPSCSTSASLTKEPPANCVGEPDSLPTPTPSGTLTDTLKNGLRKPS